MDERVTFTCLYRTTTDIGGAIALLMMMQHFKNGISHAQNAGDKEQKKERKEVKTFFFFSPTNRKST